MPYVNVKLAGSVTRDQKAKIAEEITATMIQLSQLAAEQRQQVDQFKTS